MRKLGIVLAALALIVMTRHYYFKRQPHAHKPLFSMTTSDGSGHGKFAGFRVSHDGSVHIKVDVNHDRKHDDAWDSDSDDDDDEEDDADDSE